MSSLLPHHVQDVSLTLNTIKDEEIKPSMKLASKLTKWLKSALSDTTSRNLFAFLLVNLSFAFVELFYGMWTNSLGLISDSFHMFFDCTALLAGLIATIVSKWPPNDKFSYGYVRAEIVAGFVNALFLIFIAFFIFAEAIERAFEPPEVKHERLLVVSIAGFIVNLIGIFAFHHGGQDHCHHGHSHGHSHSHHGHSHHGHSHHSHSHSHSHHDHAHHDLSHHDHSHHGHSHHHDHPTHNSSYGLTTTDHHHHDEHIHDISEGGSNSQIMQGIFLHILADTLGSVGVIISSALIHQFGWMLADPICSMFIAVLILISVFPLMRESLGVLMQRIPVKMDHTLPHNLRKINELDSVAQIVECHIWTLCSNTIVGNLRIEIFPGSDSFKLQKVIKSILSEAGVHQSYVELVIVD